MGTGRGRGGSIHAMVGRLFGIASADSSSSTVVEDFLNCTSGLGGSLRGLSVRCTARPTCPNGRLVTSKGGLVTSILRVGCSGRFFTNVSRGGSSFLSFTRSCRPIGGFFTKRRGNVFSGTLGLVGVCSSDGAFVMGDRVRTIITSVGSVLGGSIPCSRVFGLPRLLSAFVGLCDGLLGRVRGPVSGTVRRTERHIFRRLRSGGYRSRLTSGCMGLFERVDSGTVDYGGITALRGVGVRTSTLGIHYLGRVRGRRTGVVTTRRPTRIKRAKGCNKRAVTPTAPTPGMGEGGAIDVGSVGGTAA